MRAPFRQVGPAIVAGLLVACTSAPSPAPSQTPPASTRPSPPSVPSASAELTPTRVPIETPGVASNNLGLHGSAREIAEGILMAPGPDGSLFVSIPRADGSILARLDGTGRLRPGWPTTIKNTSACTLLFAVSDGSVRTVCDATDLPEPELEARDVRAFAFDANGNLMPGWPIRVLASEVGRVVGTDLTLFVRQGLTDTPTTGQVSERAWLATFAAGGSLRRGNEVPLLEPCCGVIWSIGPDGVAYGVETLRESEDGAAVSNRIKVIDRSGARDGWPEPFAGTPSSPGFGQDGRIVLTAGSIRLGTSRLLAFAKDGTGVSASSPDLPIATAETFGTGDCSGAAPMAPLLAEDGTAFLYSAIDDAVFAVDPALKVMPGWPYRPATSLVRPDSRYVKEDAFCPGFATPTLGPDRTLYLPLQARNATVGGSLVAVDPAGKVAPGWPVELKRPGSEFWAVVVGPAGTAFALAVEPESSTTSSASILGISPDSTVVYRTTIVDP